MYVSAFAAGGKPQLERLVAGGALGGAEIGAPVGLLFGSAVGLKVGLRQQISAVPAFNVVEQRKPHPSQETLSSRSPALHLPMPHAVLYWISSAAHAVCCSRRRALLDDVFGRIGARPLNREEMERMYLRDGRVWKVSDDPFDRETYRILTPRPVRQATRSR